jgi:hypothetical protein
MNVKTKCTCLCKLQYRTHPEEAENVISEEISGHERKKQNMLLQFALIVSSSHAVHRIVSPVIALPLSMFDTSKKKKRFGLEASSKRVF